MAPKGSGFIHARPEMQSFLQPLVVSRGWTPEANQPGARGPFGNAPFIDFIEMQGTRDPSAWLAVPSAIGFRHANDWWAVGEECRRLAQETAAHLAELTGLAPLASPPFSAPQMISMPIPACDPTTIHDQLLGRYSIEIPVLEWNRRYFVRLSCQGYNTKAEMGLLIDALASLLKLDRKLAPAERQAI